jgi:hypothetical protein
MWTSFVVSPCNLYAGLYTNILLCIDTIWEDLCTKEEPLDFSLKGSLIYFLANFCKIVQYSLFTRSDMVICDVIFDAHLMMIQQGLQTIAFSSTSFSHSIV